ncbi:MAG: hypothetical protein ABIJ81_01595 [Patescibacteria group bacterium]
MGLEKVVRKVRYLKRKSRSMIARDRLLFTVVENLVLYSPHQSTTQLLMPVVQ